MTVEFYKSKLNYSLQKLYGQILWDFQLKKTHVYCNDASFEEINECYTAIYNDHPELFYLSPNTNVKQQTSIGEVKSFLEYKKVFSIIQIWYYTIKIKKLLNKFLEKSKKCATKYEVVKMVCEYFIKNVKYEIDNLRNQNAATVLCKNKGQCSGISKAVKLILDYLGIECVIIDGTGKDSNGISGPHSWNLIKIDGVYTHLDVTFMMGANTGKIKPFKYYYLNYTDSQTKNDHGWDKTFYPKCIRHIKGAPSPDLPLSLKAGDGVTVKNIFSILEYERIIDKMISGRENSLIFVSRIKWFYGNLLDELLSKAVEVANKRCVCATINIAQEGEYIKVDFTWC